MTPFLYAIVTLVIAGFLAMLYFLIDLKRKAEKPVDNEPMKVMLEWMREMKQSTENTREGMQKSIDETNKAINERLDKAAQVIGSLSKELGSMSQIGPDIRRLSEVLASPKARGNFGEEMLENLLSQVLPNTAYKSQYRFNNGEVVDMIVMVGEQILPIDSKFSMENFRQMKEAKDDDSLEVFKKAFLKDVKKRIDEIQKKYILPQEGTLELALMYIPSEGVLSEVMDDVAIMAYARDKKVYCVGPNSLFYWLQSILLSLRGQQINKMAQEILRMIGGIQKESEKFGTNLNTLANHIKNAGNTMATVNNDFGKLKANITNAANLQFSETEPVALEAEKV
jgi:DNA recombination protein RmuC